MKDVLKVIALGLLLLSLRANATAAQQTSRKDACPGPIYSSKEVARRAKITVDANFSAIYKSFGSGVSLHAVVDAVLCRSGQITDIKVVEISRADIAEFLASAVSQIQFKPAEMNWHTVSQRQQFVFMVNEPDGPQIDPALAAGRLIEHLDIMGNRRFERNEIQSWIKTRAGEPFDAGQIQRDLDAILAKGYFNKAGTRVSVEEGVRGGVGVMFEVQELPWIGEIKFEGMRIEQSVLMEALKRQHIDLQTGTPYSPETATQAARAIEQVLKLTGQLLSKVQVGVEQVNSQTVTLVFTMVPQ